MTMLVTDYLPWWVGWLGPAVLLAFGLLWAVLFPALPLRPVTRRLSRAIDWPERAAAGWEGRVAISTAAIIWLPLAIGLPAIVNSSYAVVNGVVLFAVLGLGIFGRSLYQNWRFVREQLGQPLPGFRTHLSGMARRWWPLLVLFAVAVFAPSRLGSPLMIPWTVVAVAALLGTRYLAEAWVLTKVAKPADGRLNRVVAAAAARVGAEVPTAFVLETHAANAVALPTRNLVIFTSRMVDLLDEDELEAIAVHEIAHLNERRSVTRMRTIGLFAYLPLLAAKPLFGSGWPWLAGGLVLSFAVLRLLRRVSAEEESRADASAIESSHESYAFGSALLKAHREALIPSVVKGDPHGPLRERLELAGLETDFEPVPVSNRAKPFLLPLFTFFAVLIGALVISVLRLDVWDGGTGSHVALALGWNEEEVLWFAGEHAIWEGDYDKAVVFLEAAVAGNELGALESLPRALASAGRCGEVPAAYDRLLASDATARAIEYAGLWVDYCEDLD